MRDADGPQIIFLLLLHLGILDHRTDAPAAHTKVHCELAEWRGAPDVVGTGSGERGRHKAHALGQAPYILSLCRVHRTHAAPRPLKRRRA